MRKTSELLIRGIASFLVAAALAGCGSSNKEGGPQVTQTDLVNASRLGNLNCLQCHNDGKDLTMLADSRTIGSVWQNSLHNGDVSGNISADCEGCHGGGQYHWGLGPLAYPVPDYTVCFHCHTPPNSDAYGLADKTLFASTDHANMNQTPDKFFFQGGTGTRQASNRGVPEVVVGTTTPVTVNQHIEECSVCHDSNQRFVYDTGGNLLKPDPDNMPNPSASCASCHDAHQVAQTDPNYANGDYQLFRKVQVNANGANDAAAGTWVRPRLYRDDLDNPATSSYPLDGPAATGKRELNIEALCSSCHTVGTYKYAGTATHQTDVGSQWENSAHGSRNDPAWAEFSANPQAYVNPDTGLNYSNAGSHATTYPVDMSIKSGAGSSGNFQCFKCHNGIGSIDWQTNVQGTPNARVVWGDEPATCITCHDAHPRPDFGVTLNDMNIRKPVVMTNYSTTIRNGSSVVGAVKFSGNVFLDRTGVPDAALGATSVICIFCHQGRESGYTLYKEKLTAPAGITGNFFNNHYLGTAAMLWGANAYEYAGKTYSVNAAHQATNCAGCHMDQPTADNQTSGHTWVPNPANCTGCHGAITAATDLAGFLATARASGDSNNYTGDIGGATQPIAVAIQSLELKIIDLLAASGVYYDDTTYPYFFNGNITSPNGVASNHASANAFTAWTPALYKAAFNLSFAVKGLPSVAGSTTYVTLPGVNGVKVPNSSAVLVPNNSAAVHNYKYLIQLLQDAYTDLSGASLAGAVRPSTATDRPATVYGPGQ